jgi:tripartite ATP-independent transporter DctM subunit
MTVAIFLGALCGVMLMGVPVAFALLFSGLAMMWHMNMVDAQIVAQNLVGGADSFALLAVPFFILAGELMNVGGLSRRIIDVGIAFFGHLRGGLGYVAVAAAVLMASLSGSAIADTAALSAVLLPMMRQAGYPVARSCGLIAAGGIIAPVIPPSIGFILFGVASGVSITKLFLAGIVPGMLMGLSLIVTWWIIARRSQLPVSERMGAGDRMRAVGHAFWALPLPLIIIFGLKFGVFTPTEAAVVAAVYAWLVGALVYRTITFSVLRRCLIDAARLSAIVMFLIAAASVSAWLIAIAELPEILIGWVQPFIDRPILLMAILMFIVFLVGTAIDLVPSILILTPILMPIVKEAGIDPVYFGVLFIMNNAIGLITPPVGPVLNVAAGVGRVSMDAVIRGVLPFMLAQLAVLVLLIAFPSIVIESARLMTR